VAREPPTPVNHGVASAAVAFCNRHPGEDLASLIIARGVYDDTQEDKRDYDKHDGSKHFHG
jgi:hypothetical protein